MNHDLFKIINLFCIVFFLWIFSCNFFLAQDRNIEEGSDSSDYINIGLSLAIFQKFGHVQSSEGIQVTDALEQAVLIPENLSFIGHSTWRPPVWPFLIAGVFLIFGYNLVYLLVFKFLLHLLGMFLFRSTLKLLNFKRTSVLFGTFLYGISPAWQIYSRFFLSEPITLFFITLWLFLLIRFIKKKKGFYLQAFISGIVILSHPYFIFFPFSIWLLLFIQKNLCRKQLILSSLICSAVVSFWIVRNIMVLETDQIFLTTSTGAVMAKGWNKKIVKEHTNTTGDLADENLVLEELDPFTNQKYSEIQKMENYKKAASKFILNNPGTILPIALTKIKSAFNPFPETPKKGILQIGRWSFQFLSLCAMVYILFFSNKNLLKSFALGLIISTVAITIVAYSGFRLRMPQVGLELIFILYAVELLMQRIAARRI